MSLVSPTRSTQLLNCTSAIVLELQKKTIQYSHQSRLQTGELHELLRKPMNIHHVLQTCTMITGGGGIPPLPAHAQTVDTRPYLFSIGAGLGTRLRTCICQPAWCMIAYFCCRIVVWVSDGVVVQLATWMLSVISVSLIPARSGSPHIVCTIV